MKDYILYTNNMENLVKIKSSEKLFNLLVAIRSPLRYHHNIRVSSYAEIIGREIGMTKQQIRYLKTAGFVHDVGFCALHDNILEKPATLTPDEYKYIKWHPVIGTKILDCYGFPKDIINGVIQHHEAFDGSGYPLGLRENQISIYGKILFLSEYFDTITSDTPYKTASTIDVAIASVTELSNKKFDPELVDILLNSEEIASFYLHKDDICKNYPTLEPGFESLLSLVTKK